MRKKTISASRKRRAVRTFCGFSRCILLPILFFTLFICIPVRVPGDTSESILRRSDYTKSQRRAVTSLLEEAAGEGIPEELILPRLEEAIAKKVPADRVLHVLSDDIQRLREAREILMEVEGGSALVEDKGAWARTANLLAGGVSEEEIQQIAYSCRDRWEDYRSASYLFFSLVQWGLSRGSSLKLTTAVLKSSIKGENFAGIVDLLVEGRRLRISPETLTERMIERFPLVRTFEELEELILYR